MVDWISSPPSQTIKFSKALSQEDPQFRTVNKTTIAVQFATIEKIVDEIDITADCMINLIECGITHKKDYAVQMSTRRFLPARQCKKQQNTDQYMAEFSYKSRVTFMPCISASGNCAPPLFVFEGNRINCDRILMDSVPIDQPRTSTLPPNAVIATRQTIAEVDPCILLSWAHWFLTYIKRLRVGLRKVLLVYDGYRSHLSLSVL